MAPAGDRWRRQALGGLGLLCAAAGMGRTGRKANLTGCRSELTLQAGKGLPWRLLQKPCSV